MSHSRPVVRGACYALTRRTNYRKAFLAPWHPDVSRALLYSLGSAQEAGVTLHCFVANVTHYHLSHSDDHANRPTFVRLFNGDVSRALNMNKLLREAIRVERLLTEVRETYREEAGDVVEVNALELVGEKPRVTVKPQPGARPPAKAKHRFDKNEPSDAARIVVKRDARTGRPRRPRKSVRRDDGATTTTRHRGDSDPPE